MPLRMSSQLVLAILVPLEPCLEALAVACVQYAAVEVECLTVVHSVVFKVNLSIGKDDATARERAFLVSLFARPLGRLMDV